MISQPTARESAGRIFLSGAFLILLTFVVYWPCLRGEFLWDDDVLLTGNSLMSDPGGLRKIWLGQGTPDYFPLTLTTLWIEWRVFGLKSFGYHVVNVLLHALGAILFWRILRRLAIPGALASASIFAVHPLCVSSVAWIAERKNTLSLVFFLLAFLFYLKSEKGKIEAASGDSTGKFSFRWYVLALITFLCSLLSKTSVVTFPILLLVLAWWQRGGINRQDIVKTLPFFLLSLALGLVTMRFQAQGAMFEQAENKLTQILGGGWALWFYLFKAFVPVKLSMIYPRWEIATGSFLAWLPWIFWIGMMAVLWRHRATWGRSLFFAASVFTITLAPVLGFFAMTFFSFSRVADHLVYASMIAVVPVMGALLTMNWWKPGKTGGEGWNVPMTATLLILAILTWNRSHVFASSEKLWSDTLKKNPKAWAAYNHLGEALAWKGEISRSVEMFERAVELKPDYAFARNNLGNAYAAMKRFPDAYLHFAEAIRLWPNYAEAENGWGQALVGDNRLPDAIPHFENALKHAPRYWEARCNLVAALFQMKNFVQTAEHCRLALKDNPNDATIRLCLGLSLLETGKLEEAGAELQEVIRIQPQLAEAHAALGSVRLRQKRIEEATGYLREAVRLDPNNATALENLGKIQNSARIGSQ